MGFSKLVDILFLQLHKGGRKKEKTEEVDKKIGVERCKKVQKERETTKEGDKGVVAKCYKKQEEKRKGRQRWTKWLVLNDVRKRGRYAENKTREI